MPANRENARSISRIAGFDSTGDNAGQYRFVKVASDERVQLAGNGERALGVLSGKGPADHAVPVDISGRVLVELGATVAAGDNVQSDADGKAITQASTGVVLGVCLDGGVAGDIGSINLAPQGAP